jgi:hypothetical protein
MQVIGKIFSRRSLLTDCQTSAIGWRLKWPKQNLVPFREPQEPDKGGRADNPLGGAPKPKMLKSRVPTCKPSASKPLNQPLKRERNPRFLQHNGLRFFAGYAAKKWPSFGAAEAIFERRGWRPKDPQSF